MRCRSRALCFGVGCVKKRRSHAHCLVMGAFSHSAGTAPIVTLLIPGAPLKTTHPQKRA